MQIEISNEIYQRLEQHAIGFDSPEAVIKRLLDKVDAQPTKKPVIDFSPSDEAEFKSQLINRREAEVIIYKTDGTREISHWKANKITKTSNVRGNLWSGPLRGWKEKGIESVEVNILPFPEYDRDGIPDDTELRKIIAEKLSITFEEAQGLYFDIDTNESEDGVVYESIIRFVYDSCDEEAREKAGLEGDDEIYIDSSDW
ncbi:hypothetical protein [Veronia nyctiphanis]|nr:hypothetical protein [Veronia nyctiphanis]